MIEDALGLALWLAGLGHFAVLGASFQVPARLGWRDELARLRPLNRKLMWTYGGFTVLTIVAFGTLTLAGGTLSIGASPGLIHSGTVTFDEDSTFAVELDGTLPAQYDRLDVTGEVHLGDATLSLAAGFASTLGDTFIIIANDGSDDIGASSNVSSRSVTGTRRRPTTAKTSAIALSERASPATSSSSATKGRPSSTRCAWRCATGSSRRAASSSVARGSSRASKASSAPATASPSTRFSARLVT